MVKQSIKIKMKGSIRQWENRGWSMAIKFSMNSSSAIFTWQLFQVCASTGMFNELHYPY
jgi:hypothetical protein